MTSSRYTIGKYVRSVDTFRLATTNSRSTARLYASKLNTNRTAAERAAGILYIVWLT